MCACYNIQYLISYTYTEENRRFFFFLLLLGSVFRFDNKWDDKNLHAAVRQTRPFASGQPRVGVRRGKDTPECFSVVVFVRQGEGRRHVGERASRVQESVAMNGTRQMYCGCSARSLAVVARFCFCRRVRFLHRKVGAVEPNGTTRTAVCICGASRLIPNLQ